MDLHGETILRKHLAQTKKALEEHYFQAFIVKDGKAACELASSMIQDHEKVSDGGSMTLTQIGLSQRLKTREITYLSHNDPTLSKAENEKEAHDAFCADTFICSCNAVTMDGSLINVDGRGNRVAAMIYGPKQVIVVVGSNKIVKDEEEAKNRIKQFAAPTNCVRLQRKTPCTSIGVCQDCNSLERICNFYVKIDRDLYDRIKVILIEETYGY